jgi:hypothetical protein
LHAIYNKYLVAFPSIDGRLETLQKIAGKLMKIGNGGCKPYMNYISNHIK